MKVALCVRYDCDNYGSMLQILSTQNSLKKFGVQYEILRYDKITPLFLLRSISRLFNADFVRGKGAIIKKKYMLKNHPDVNNGDAIRRKKFSEYREKYIGPYSRMLRGYNSIVEAASEYDAVMVGSDQLWAPAGLESNYYNLIFVPDGVRKISFATSFGVSEIPPRQKKKTANYLKRIDYISVREVSGAKIVKELTGRDAVVAADPTLMISKEEWDKTFPPKRIINEPYIFAYFLGDNIEHRRIVMNLKKLLGYKVVTCPHLDSYIDADNGFGDIQRYDTDPEDFLNLIRYADYICTDSFHGSIFSLLNHKQFATFRRFKENDKLSKNSRIESLFTTLGVQDRLFSSYDHRELLDILNKTIDYSSVDLHIEILRNETTDFLEKALRV